jgi:magnesium transporter
MTQSRFYYFTGNGVVHTEESASAAIENRTSGGFIWLNYYNPTREELMAISDSLGIHPLSVEDCVDSSQIPKIEQFPKNTFLIFNAFTYEQSSLIIDEVDMVIGENFLVTVRGINSDGRDPLNGAETVSESEHARRGPAFLMHMLLDHIVDRKFSAVEAMEDELETAEEKVIESPSSFNPATLINLRRNLLSLRKSLFHEREILVKICRLDSPFIGEKAVFHYRDVYDHLTKFLELSENYREIVTSLMELYTSVLNNIMTKASNATNLSVRRLTLIATIFMPLTLIASIGGMSEWSMITGPDNWKVSYPLFMLGMVVIGAITFVVLRILEKRGLRRFEEPAEDK